MRRLTMRQVMEEHGGKLPNDAMFRPDVEPEPPPPASTKKPGKRRNRSERFATLNSFIDFGIADADLTPAEALVWLVLFRDTKDAGTARTGQTDIARRAGLSVRGVKYALRTLGAKGMVRVIHRGRLNKGPSTYRVHPTGDMVQ